jgi:hypothetical protein
MTAGVTLAHELRNTRHVAPQTEPAQAPRESRAPARRQFVRCSTRVTRMPLELPL